MVGESSQESKKDFKKQPEVCTRFLSPCSHSVVRQKRRTVHSGTPFFEEGNH